jgi:hypothetical protein
MKRLGTLAALLATSALIAGLILTGLWVAHTVEEREACDGLSASLCQALRESDVRECRAGEGCGRP